MKQLLPILFILCTLPLSAFNVVIDAGHGGKDPGAVGANLYEKNLNLEVSLAVGKLISDNFSDTKVFYTRTTDKFLSLQERADFVNQHKADLFICIHTNAAENKTMTGTETFVLGLHKAESNLAVAMRENAVMMLEDDYQTKYQGFNPQSAESYIMFEFLQDEYLDRSLSFAALVQQQFTAQTNLADRGVKQAGFWVLHKSACPSVLVEMGFISNRAEEQYLASQAGKQAIEQSIYNAFVSYREKTDGKRPAAQQVTTPPTQQDNIQLSTFNIQHSPVFRVQIFSSPKILKAGDATFKGLKNCKYIKDGKYYKYTYGESTDYKEIQDIQRQLKTKFRDCFIVAFLDDKQILVKDALKMIQQ